MLNIFCLHSLYSDIWRVADHRVEAAGSKHVGEGALPVERVDALDLFIIREHLPLEVVPADQGVAAANVLTQVGQDAIKRLIQARGRVDQILGQALGEGMRTLRQDGMEKVLAGITDMKQVRKVCVR